MRSQGEQNKYPTGFFFESWVKCKDNCGKKERIFVEKYVVEIHYVVKIVTRFHRENTTW